MRALPGRTPCTPWENTDARIGREPTISCRALRGSAQGFLASGPEMGVVDDRESSHDLQRSSSNAARTPGLSAAVLARRISWTELGFGALGLASCAVALLRLFETWRISPRASSHRFSILGQTLTYPAANLAAVVVLFLGFLGAVVAARATTATVQELLAARRFARRVARGELRRVYGALVIEDDRPAAFCAGLLRPQVYVTSGVLTILDEGALEAVLAHERHHAQCRDPLRLAASRVLAEALFFLPSLRGLGHRRQELSELDADESVVIARTGNRAALARAMLSFSDSAEAGMSEGIEPARIDYLLGESDGWRFPVLLCLATVTFLAMLMMMAVLAGREAAASATLAPPFLSAQPCVVMLALVPAAVSLVAARIRRRSRRILDVPTTR